jgi:uncharacterized delta-60 repeat protein
MVSLFVIVFQAFAQPPDSLWSRSYGGINYDEARSVQQTADGGYIVAGRTLSFGAGLQDFYLVKTDNCGEPLWTRTYGGSSTDEAYSVQQTADGGYIVAGRTLSFGAGYDDFYLVKTNSQGDTLWTHTYGGWSNEYANSVRQTADGGYIMAGWTWSFGVAQDFYLVKANSSGDTLWTRTYGGSSSDWAYSVQQTADGGYIVAGETASFGAGDYDFYVVKTNAYGTPLWTRTYGRSGDDRAFSIQQTADGGYVVAGSTQSFGAGAEDFYLVKTNSLGDTLWTRTFGGSSWDVANSVQQTADGGYIVAGYTESFCAGCWEFYLVKTNSLGDTLWTRTYGGSGTSAANSVQQTTDGGYVMAGFNGSEDMWIVRVGFSSPDIISITDVGNDQGRQARIRWYHSGYDECSGDYTITSYSIYRRIDQYLMDGGMKAERETLDWPPGEWDFVVNVLAGGEENYATIVPTLADSTSEGIYWSVFFVRAHTPNPLIHFDSEPDSGYSIDNLPPDETILTAMVQLSPGRILLQWQEVTTGGEGQPEPGEIWYRVYGSTDPMFTPAPENLLGVTQDWEFTHEVGANQKYFYIIQASDDH